MQLKTQEKHKLYHTIPAKIKALNYLLDHNICDNQIEEQLKQDRKV